MPYVDRRSGDLVVRVVLDGPVEGGKTSCVAAVVHALELSRRSTPLGPAYVWDDIPGGFAGHRSIRCEVFGDAPLDAAGRRRVLESADAVVFVADSHPLLVEDTRLFLEGLRSVLGPSDTRAPVGLLVLANKQDRQRAVPPAALALRLGVDTATPVVGSVATEGQGVVPAFRFAVNAAIARLRHMLARDVELPIADAGESEPPASGPALESVPGGAAWPQETARQVLERACTGSFRASRRPRGWMFDDAVELRSTTGLLLHSRPTWRLPTLESARVELARQVRSWLPWRDVLPEERCAMVAADQGAWRVWVISPDVATWEDELLSTPTRVPTATVERLAGSWDRLRRRVEVPRLVGAAETNGRTIYLPLPGWLPPTTTLSAKACAALVAHPSRRGWPELDPT